MSYSLGALVPTWQQEMAFIVVVAGRSKQLMGGGVAFDAPKLSIQRRRLPPAFPPARGAPPSASPKPQQTGLRRIKQLLWCWLGRRITICAAGHASHGDLVLYHSRLNADMKGLCAARSS